MKEVVITFLVLTLASSAYSLSCLPCENKTCEEPKCGEGVTLVKEACGCCDVCSKQLGEKCGGPWDIYGICDDPNGLVCVKYSEHEDDFNADGFCRRKEDAASCIFPKIFTDCPSNCQPSCDEPVAPDFCNLACATDEPCLCAPGHLRRSKTNRTCIRMEECDAPERTGCEAPKIFNDCPTYCPATCLEPFPQAICPAACNPDRCVCPRGFILRSLSNRTCVRDFECEDFSFCDRQLECPPIDLASPVLELRKSWSCNLATWKCTTYKWRMELNKWWVEDCHQDSDALTSLWSEMKNMCDSMPGISCKNSEAMRCTTDAFGCFLCDCDDGLYQDPNKLLLAWRLSFDIYQSYMKIYKKAKDMCTMYY